MANYYQREPIDGSDQGVWGPKELQQNRVANGVITCELYDDSGTLKLTTGKIGMDNGSSKGVIIVDTVTTISLVSVSNANWFKVEVSVSGTVPTFTATDISGETDNESIPDTLDDNYDNDKGGYYIDTSKRCIGMGFKTSGGSLGGIVNVDSIREGYLGDTDAIGQFLSRFGNDLLFLPKRILHMRHITAGATGGGAATTGSWQDTNLNTLISNNIDGASFYTGTGGFTLPAGTYFISGYQCFFRTDRSQIRLYNTSDAATVSNCIGASSFSNTAASYADTKSIIKGRFTITGEKNFKVQYQVGSNVGANDLGVESNYGENNIFEDILIIKEK